MPRRHALALALLLLASPALGQDLVTNGDFTSGVSALDGARSVGAFSSVRRSDDTMLAFPGTKTTALQLLPGAEVAINAALSTHLREGWYQIKFFLYVSADYTYSGGGASTTPLRVDVCDSSGAVISPREYRIPLRAARNEWLHYNEWVPVNRIGDTAARLTIGKGVVNGLGLLQLTGLSIEYKAFADRALDTVDVCRCTTQVDGAGVCGNTAAPECVPTACPLEGQPGQCPSGYSNAIETAYDGRVGRDDGWTAAIVAGDGTTIDTIALEIDLGEEKPVCGFQLYFDNSRHWANTWRVSGYSSTTGYTQWAAAGASGGGAEVVSGPAGWEVTLGGTVGRHSYGLECQSARRVRLEMEDSESDLFMKLLEILIYTEGSSFAECNCRHGGLCANDGSCTCPAAQNCVQEECGWETGPDHPDCTGAVCVAGVTCNNFGYCSGSNTCTCQLGWSGSDGAEQCTIARCGDGGVTVGAAGGNEECDDGNLEPGDGCDQNCQLEDLPPTRQIQPGGDYEWQQLYLPREEIYAPTVSRATVAATVSTQCACPVYAEQIQNVEQVTRQGRIEVKYEYTELPCLSECFNGAKCVTRNFQEACDCPAGWEGADCSVSQCAQGCDHGGTCVGPDTCGRVVDAEASPPTVEAYCEGGWEGTFCGTAGGGVSMVVLILGLIQIAIFAGSILLTCCRCSWLPIKARGPFTLILGAIGGTVWIVTVLASINAEMFGLDIREGSETDLPEGSCIITSSKRPYFLTDPWPRDASETCVNPISCWRGRELSEDGVIEVAGELSTECGGNAALWHLWLPLVAGCGVWLASNLVYLRAMAQIHIFHHVPLVALILFVVLLWPWAVVAWIGSPFGALILGAIFLAYTLLLFAELWPIRKDFVDVTHHAWGSILGLALMVIQLFLINGSKWTISADISTIEDNPVVSANLLVYNGLATVLVIMIHFATSAGHLLYLALARANDPHILEQYYDEYNPDDKEHFKADMLAFDHQIRTHRQNIPDHSIKARAGRAAKINDNMQDGELAFAARCPCTPLLFVDNAVHSHAKPRLQGATRARRPRSSGTAAS